MDDDFSLCFVTNSRMAARAITRRYDAVVRPFGITAAQLSLLAAIRLLPGATVSELAEARGFERTTLTRNLDRLTAMGLVAADPAHTGTGRVSVVTEAGLRLIADALPAWRRAQAEMADTLGEAAFSESVRILKRLAKV